MNERGSAQNRTVRRFHLLFMLLSIGSSMQYADAVAPSVAISELHPSPEHRRATRLITHLLTNFHYTKRPLNDTLSEQVFTRYLDALDPSRSYLLEDDVADFKRHQNEFDDYLNNSDLQPIFDMFIRYRERVSERSAYAISLLDMPIDFSIDEDFVFDRDESPWPASRQELDELWRKRVKNDFLSLKLTSKPDPDIKETLRKRYQEMERLNTQRNSEDVYQIFINAYTTSLDPHTSYFSPRTSENFKIRMSLSLEGIGAVLQSDNEFTVVREIVTGGPADKSAALHPGDRIVAIGQGSEEAMVDVIGWRLDDVVDLIRGPKGTTVRLDILAKGAGPETPGKTLSLVRNEIKLEEQAARLKIRDVTIDSETRHIAVINIPTFYLDFDARASGSQNYRSTTRDVRRLISEIPAEGIDGLVIDLRNNGGGSLSEATELTGLFIDRGPVVQVRYENGSVQLERDTDPGVAYAGPLAVLVDRNSASASEIFASAIQDYQRGLIIGEPTFGKGTVQELVDLNRYDKDMNGQLGQLKATRAQFFRVQGGSTQHKGVLPDIALPTATAADDQGERSLDNALPWAEIDPARYQPVNAIYDVLENVRTLHSQRMQNDEAFQTLVELERAFAEDQASVKVSLVEAIRRTEYERNLKLQRERENRLRVARGLQPLPEGESASADEAEKPDSEIAAEEQERYDVVLDETAHILADFVGLSSPDTSIVRVANGTEMKLTN